MYVFIVILLIVLVFLVILATQRIRYKKELNKCKEINSTININLKKYKSKCQKLRNITKYYEDKEKYIINKNMKDNEIAINKEKIFKMKKALVIDNILISYENTKKVLKKLGFLSVNIVSTKEKAIKEIENKHIDIIFINEVLKESTAIEILTVLKKNKDFNIPIVVYSSSQNKEFFCDELGFDDFIISPLSFEETKLALYKVFSKNNILYL